jgi:hypothetical protein
MLLKVPTTTTSAVPFKKRWIDPETKTTLTQKKTDTTESSLWQRIPTRVLTARITELN